MFRINRTLTKLFVGCIAALVISVMACGTDKSEQDSGSDEDDLIQEEPQTPGHSHNAPSIASHDGRCLRVGASSFVSSDRLPRAGDRESPFSYVKAIFSFDLSDVPTDIIIESATLNVYQSGIPENSPANPYKKLWGGVLASVVHIAIDPTVALQNSACTVSGVPVFDDGQVSSAILSDSGGIEGEYKTMDVTAEVKDDLANGRLVSAYRIGPEDFNGDAFADLAFFNDAENHAGNGQTPFIEIVFRETE